MESRQPLIVEIVDNKVWGGGETYARDLCTALCSKGFDLLIATRGVKAVDDGLRSSGAPILNLPLGGVFDFSSPRRLCVGIARMAESGRAVTLHLNNFKQLPLAMRVRRRLAGRNDVRVVVTRHLARKAKTGRRYRRLYEAADAIVFVSATARDEFMKSVSPGSRIDSILCERIHVVGNALLGIVPELSARVGQRKENDEEVVVLYAGRMAHEKGIDLLLEALGRIAALPWKLLAAGTGPEPFMQTLAAKAESLGIADRIFWEGYVDSLRPLLDRADVGVFPSVAKESFGLVLLEFMSAGLPIVSTDTGAQRELLCDGEEGLLAAPDAEALAGALARMISDRDFRKRASELSLKRYESHDYSAFLGRMLPILLGSESGGQNP